MRNVPTVFSDLANEISGRKLKELSAFYMLLIIKRERREMN